MHFWSIEILYLRTSVHRDIIQNNWNKYAAFYSQRNPQLVQADVILLCAQILAHVERYDKAHFSNVSRVRNDPRYS